MSNLANRIETLSPKRLALLAMELDEKLQALRNERTEPIAVVGIGCRLPGSCTTPNDFWTLLENGRDAVAEVPRDRWDIDEYYNPDPDAPGQISSRWGGFLAEIDRFDAPFFGISRREAISMDPQQRLLLEVCWESLEDAGQSPHRLQSSRTGVYVGIANSDYYSMLLGRSQDAFDAYLASGAAHSVAAGRVSYILGLHGPSFPVDTACSSSLVAVHLALQGLRNRECDMALAGGVNAILTPDISIALSRSHMFAADGRCKAFDARADGFVRGEGCGMVVLKRLSDALANRGPIRAVIRGSAVNQDGRSSGLTAPNGASQETVIRQALANAQVGPEEIDYVEAHGTGTSLGDPIEAHALAAVLGAGRTAERPLVVGSVKTNIGHVESAAGIAGLIKVILSLEQERIPPHLHFERMNPHIDWRGVPVEIPVKGRAWPRVAGRRRLAGVSSFGFSGTNAHVIVEEAPLRTPVLPAAPDRGVHVLALSARTAPVLEQLAEQYAGVTGRLEDICYTANTGRAALAERMVLDAATRSVIARGKTEGRLEVVFLFTGQGAQYAGMGRELYQTEPVFRREIERCGAAELLYGGHDRFVEDTRYTQPAGYALQVALAALWRSWGVEPAIVVGHSVGEYAAAAVAGVYSVEEGMRLITERGRLTGGLPQGQGAMAVILAPREEVEAETGPRVSVAACNGPENVVISGCTSEVEEICARFRGRGRRAERLRVSHGFHSPLMEPVASKFERFAAGIRFETPQVTMISTVTGRAVTAEEISCGAYWRQQLRGAVRYAQAMRAVAEQELFVEIGPGSTVAGMGRELIGRDTQLWLPSIRRSTAEPRQMTESLAHLWVRGVEVDWDGYYKGREGRRVSLPTYPFDRQRYWIETGRGSRLTGRARNPFLGGRVDAALETYEGTVDLDSAGWIRDHRVQGTSVVPAAAYLEIALAAAANRSVADMELREPLRIESTCPVRTLQTVIDGEAFRIFSKADNAWRLHTTGSLKTARSTVAEDLAAVRERNAKQFSVSEFYTALAARGIDLGAECRHVQRLWAGTDEALAEIQGAEAALLDTCFQVIGAALLYGTDGELPGTYVLHRIESYTQSGTLTGPVFAHAQVHRDGSGLRAGLAIYSAQGQLIAQAAGIHLGLLAAAAPQDWFYRLEWQPQPLPSSEADLRTIDIGALREEIAVLARRNGLAHYDELRPELEQLCKLYAAEALAAPLSPIDKHRRLYQRLSALPTAGAGNADKLCERLLQDYPEFAAELTLVRRCGSRLREVLLGEEDPLQLLAPDGSFETLERLYGESPAARVFNTAAARALEAALPSDQPVRILEIGAGTGGTTGYLLGTLRTRQVEYTFTDVSPLFTARARERFTDCSFLRYETLDIEQPAKPAQRYDAIVAANVLHATADLRGTLRHVRNLLKDRGLLLLIEGTRPELWVDLTFGMTEGWWKFSDPDLRSSHPLLDREQWIELLAQEGFRSSAVQPFNGSQQVLFLAEATFRPAEGVGLTIFDARDGATCAQLARVIRTAKETRVWAVTTGADSDPEMAALWGVARTAALEYPDTWGGIIDLPRGADAEAVIRREARGSAEDQVEYRDGLRYVPRLVRLTSRTHTIPRFRSDGVYIVTGGAGNLGRKLAGWLVQHGARELILTSRTPEMSDDLEMLRAAGVCLDLVAADIADPKSVDLFLAAARGRRICGIVHAAAVFDSTLLADISANQFDAVRAPKATGAENLLALCNKVDFLVLFSSTTALLGVRGMAAYAAANAAMDALAQRARLRGIPAVSINWGTWDEMGRATESAREMYRRSGLFPMPSAQALEALSAVLASGLTQAVVADIDWTTLKALYESRRRRPMLELLASAPTHVAPPPPVSRDLESTLAEIPPADRANYIVEIVRQEAAAVLGLKPDEIDSRTGLFEMGMDSLMSVELKRRLELACSGTLPSTLTFDHPNVESLARYLYELMEPADRHEAPGPAVRNTREDLSEDDLAELLLEALKTHD